MSYIYICHILMVDKQISHTGFDVITWAVESTMIP